MYKGVQHCVYHPALDRYYGSTALTRHDTVRQSSSDLVATLYRDGGTYPLYHYSC